MLTWTLAIIYWLLLHGTYARVKPTKADDVWITQGDFEYWVSTDKATFEESRQQCQQRGAYLASFNYENPGKDVSVHFKENENLFVGFNDIATEDVWLFDNDQSPVRYVNWESGQPDGGGLFSSADCAVYNTESGQYRDEDCSDSYRFVCQKAKYIDTTTAPSTSTSISGVDTKLITTTSVGDTDTTDQPTATSSVLVSTTDQPTVTNSMFVSTTEDPTTANIAINGTTEQPTGTNISINGTTEHPTTTNIAINGATEQPTTTNSAINGTTEHPTATSIAINGTTGQPTGTNIAMNGTTEHPTTTNIAINGTTEQPTTTYNAINGTTEHTTATNIAINGTTGQPTGTKIAINGTTEQPTTTKIAINGTTEQTTTTNSAINVTTEHPTATDIAINGTTGQATGTNIAINDTTEQPTTTNIAINGTAEQPTTTNSVINGTNEQPTATSTVINGPTEQPTTTNSALDGTSGQATTINIVSNGTTVQLITTNSATNGTTVQLTSTNSATNGSTVQLIATSRAINGTTVQLTSTNSATNGTTVQLIATSRAINGTTVQLTSTNSATNGPTVQLTSTSSAIHGTNLQLITTNSAFNGALQQFTTNTNSNEARAYQEPRDRDTCEINFEKCGGLNQSPIDILANGVSPDVCAGPITFCGFERTEGIQLVMSNTGHAIQVDVSVGTTGSHQLVNGKLPGTYQLAQFNFHFGSSNTMGSEHTVDGKHYPMEMQLVAYNTVHENLSVASKMPRGLAIVGVFFEIDGADVDNGVFGKVTDNLNKTSYLGNQTIIETFSLLHLLPNTDHYFRYLGSLTTSSCDESVVWTIMTDTISISQSQMDQFRSGLFSDRTGQVRLIDNFRPTQPLNGRTVYKID